LDGNGNNFIKDTQGNEMEDIRFSVVIPFYNAKGYVTQAVESALQQPETGEILLIEDGSPDGGLEICQQLTQQHSKIKLLRHPDGCNMGPSVSRTLGVKNAIFEYVAFLDADDYYLQNRFVKTVEVIKSNANVDGVYEATGTTFESGADKEVFQKTALSELLTIKIKINPEILFEELMKLKANYGSFHLDGLTVRKRLFEKTGYFNEQLKVHQDTEMMWKMIALGRLFPGNISEPVSMWRAHGINRITYHQANKRKHYQTSLDMWNFLSIWGRKNLSWSRRYLLSLRYIAYMRKADNFDDFKTQDFMASRGKMFQQLKEYPQLMFDPWFWRLVIPSKAVFFRAK